MKTTILQTLITLALTQGVFAQVADIFVAQDDGGVEVPAGGTVVYAIDYGNLGPDRAPGVEILDLVPENTRFDAAASSPGWSIRSPPESIGYSTLPPLTMTSSSGST